MIQIIESQEVKLYYDSDRKQLKASYLGFVRSSNFRHAIDSIVESSVKYDVHSLLVDSLNQGPVSKEDNEYASSTMPSLAENGLKYMAFVMPQQIITAMGVKRFSKINNSDVQLGHFTRIDEAEDWILNESEVTDS